MEKIKKLRKILKNEGLDGYIIPKNDEFFSEYIPDHNDRLNFITSFSGSYGFALIFKNQNYLFVDGRYTLQANNQSGKSFKIITIPDKMPSDILQGKEISIGFDPNLFTKIPPRDERLLEKSWFTLTTEKLFSLTEESLLPPVDIFNNPIFV